MVAASRRVQPLCTDCFYTRPLSRNVFISHTKHWPVFRSNSSHWPLCSQNLFFKVLLTHNLLIKLCFHHTNIPISTWLWFHSFVFTVYLQFLLHVYPANTADCPTPPLNRQLWKYLRVCLSRRFLVQGLPPLCGDNVRGDTALSNKVDMNSGKDTFILLRSFSFSVPINCFLFKILSQII